MSNIEKLIEQKSTFICRQFGDLKLYIKEKFEKYNNSNFLIDFEVELLKEFRTIKKFLVLLLLFNLAILILLIFRG